MPEFENQHYVPKGILNNFGNMKTKGKYEVCMIDIINAKVGFKSTEYAMNARNIYDVKDTDIKILEKKFNTEIEDPMMKIVEKLLKKTDVIRITRRQLAIIKKYMLIQIFRSLPNREGYANPPEREKLLSDYNIRKGESKLDFWKREMMTILNSDWDSLLESKDLISVRFHARTLHGGFLMFFRTKEEFVINDSGVVCERIHLEIPEQIRENLIEGANKMMEESFGINDPDNIAKYMSGYKRPFIDTGIWMPLSSNFAIVNVNRILRPYVMGNLPIPHPFSQSNLIGHLSLPKTTYVNETKIYADLEDQMKNHETKISTLSDEEAFSLKNMLMDEVILKNKNDKDAYEYEVRKIGASETKYWNSLVMNEVHQYLCFKTPQKIIPAIEEYNQLKAEGMKGVNHDYRSYVSLLKTLKNT